VSILKQTLTAAGISLFSLVSTAAITTVTAPSAYAATYHPQVKSIYINGKLINHPYGIVKNNTTYVAIKYVMQALNKLGIQSTWDGTTWRLTAPAYMPVDLTNIPTSHGSKAIWLNGKLVYHVDSVVYQDPATHESTTYMPIVYIEHLLNRLAIGSTWDGYSWRMTTPPPISVTVANPSQYPTLRQGNDGYPVVLLQQKLNAAGFNVGPIDGQFGTKTLAAVKKFQASAKLSVDGIVGPRTWMALNQRLASKFSIPIDSGTKSGQGGSGSTGGSAGQTGTTSGTSPGTTTPTPPHTGSKIVQAWVNSISSITDAENQPTINRIANDNYEFTASGALTIDSSVSTASQNLVNYGKAHGVNVYATVTNIDAVSGNFSKSLVDTLLNSQSNRQRLAQNLVNLAVQKGYSGIDIDFEYIPPTDKVAFSGFLSDLATRLHQAGKQLSVTVPARTGDTAEPWDAAYDYAAIGRVADWVPIMTYDFSWSGGPAGPIAPLYWDEQVLNYAKTKVSAGKILLGLGAYGYDWDLTTGKPATAKSLPTIDAMIHQYSVKPEWDSTDAVPYFSYHDASGHNHMVYYENQASIQQKLALADQYGVAGVAFWKAGLEDQGFWNALTPWAKP
jgi:spore germination protein YaaH